MEPDEKDVIKTKKEEVSKKFEAVLAPLKAYKARLLVKKEIFKFLCNLEDENIWIEEKRNLGTSEDYHKCLQAVNLLIKKTKTLKGKIDNHEPRIVCVYNTGLKLIESGHPNSEQLQKDISELQDRLADLKEMLEAMRQKLLLSEKAQQSSLMLMRLRRG